MPSAESEQLRVNYQLLILAALRSKGCNRSSIESVWSGPTSPWCLHKQSCGTALGEAQCNQGHHMRGVEGQPVAAIASAAIARSAACTAQPMTGGSEGLALHVKQQQGLHHVRSPWAGKMCGVQHCQLHSQCHLSVSFTRCIRCGS